MIPRRRVHVQLRDELRLLRRLARGSADPAAVARLEAAVAKLVGVKHAVAVASGRRAMSLILAELGVGVGTELIVPAYTLGALTPLVEALGAQVVPADIELASLNMDPEAVRRCIGPRTRGILALHAFGTPCHIDALAQLARDHGLALVEDCAHALGAELNGRAVGSWGDASFVSFETTKPLNTWGGGMVLSDDATLCARIRDGLGGERPDPASVRGKLVAVAAERVLFGTGLAWPALLGLASPTVADGLATFYRRFQHAPPTDLAYLPAQAELGLAKLDSLTSRIASRERSAQLLSSLLHPSIRTQHIPDSATPTRYFFVAVLPEPAGRARRRLLLRGIDAGVGDEIADDVAAMQGLETCPKLEGLHPRAIQLPLWDHMPDRVVRRVAAALNAALR